MNDPIERQAALEAVRIGDSMRKIQDRIMRIPAAEPEPKEIGYKECASAMLKMWIDNVLRDSEYNRIMDRLNAHQRKTNE